MIQKVTITSLLLALWNSFSLAAQSTQAYTFEPGKHAVYVHGLVAAATDVSTSYKAVALAGFSYEQVVYTIPKKHCRLAGVIGMTPPLGEDVPFISFHIGPKLYWGDKTNWFTVATQYAVGLGKIYEDGPFYTNGGYLEVGYCYLGHRGFFFNPQVVVEGDEYNKSLNFGLSLGLGYCF